VSKLALLKSAASLNDLADLIGFSASGLAFILYKTPNAAKYAKFQIPKKSGGTREICAPIGAMKAVQRELATLLNDCRAEIQKENPRPPISHGFREGLSIVTNAHGHTCRRFVLNLDLADFFPSFNFGRVRGFFIKDRDFALHDKVATFIAQIACFENQLPQGSPCSPVIADMIAHVLDMHLVRLAKKHRVTYSRYADDLTFSTNQKTFPDAVAKSGDTPAEPWVIGDELKRRVVENGFCVNSGKTRMHFKGSRQMVTGLTVNEKVNVSQRYWRSIRSMCHALYQTGSYHFPVSKSGVAEGANLELLTKLDPLIGMLSHAYHVKRKSNRFPDAAKPHVCYGQADLARFWFYRWFVALDRPLILCEGVTDNIYIRNAIARIPAFQPILGARGPNGFRYTVSFFKYSNHMHRVLGVTGGFSPILTLIHGYRKKLEVYKHRPLAFPVIVVMDNDTALSDKTTKPLQKQFGVSINHGAKDLFFHLTDNLYLVKTPNVPGKPMSCIEDLFDDTTKSIPVEGKSFCAEDNGFNKDINFGKAVFAHRVVAPKAATISWQGFVPLLERIVAVIEDYAAKRTAA